MSKPLEIFLALLILFPISSSLSRVHYEFVRHIVTDSSKCTNILYDLSNLDVEAIRSRSDHPFVTVKSLQVLRGDKHFQTLLSVSVSECITIFSTSSFSGKTELELLKDALSRTRHMTVVNLNASFDVTPFLSTFLKDDMVSVKLIPSGDLLITKYCSTTQANEKNIWIDKDNTLLNPDLPLASSQTSCRSSLRGRTDLSVSFGLTLFPFIFILPNKDVSGAEVETFNIMAKKVGFKFTLRKELYWLKQDAQTKKWQGVIGNIINGTSQFALSMTAIFRPGDPSTFPIDFSAETYQVENVLLVPKPRPLKPLANFLRPFTKEVWLTLFGASVATCVMLCLLTWMDEPKTLSISDTVLDVYGSLFAQKLMKTLDCPSDNLIFMVLGLWIICTLFKGAAYSCNLRTFIVKQDFEKLVETNEDLVEQKMDLYLPLGSPIATIYKASSDPTQRKIYDRAVRRQTFYDRSTSRMMEQRMVQEKGALVVMKPTATFQLQELEAATGPDHDYMSARTPVESHGVAFAMQMYQPWQEEVNQVVMRIVDAGITEFMVRRFSPVNKYTFAREEREEEELKPYRVEHVEGALVVLGVGLVVSAVTVGLEVVASPVRKLLISVRID